MKDRTIRIRINYGSYEWKLLISLDLSAKSVELWDMMKDIEWSWMNPADTYARGSMATINTSG